MKVNNIELTANPNMFILSAEDSKLIPMNKKYSVSIEKTTQSYTLTIKDQGLRLIAKKKRIIL